MTDIKGKYCSLTFLNLSAYSWLVAKMPEILTYNTPPNIERGKTKQSIFKSFFDSFNSKDKFTKLSLITFALIIIATPFIVNQYLDYRQKAASTRDPSLWPFARNSIWNLPIGASASYSPANFPSSTGNGINTEDEMIMINPANPLRQTYMRTGQWNATCSEGSDFGSFHVPDGLTTPLTSGSFLPNNTGGALKSDGKTIQEGIWIARCSGTGPLYWGYGPLGTHDIYGLGLVGGSGGGHGGSGLSAVGGSLRHWELQGDEPIRHALKLTVPTKVLSKSGNGGRGYKWPAVRADGGYDGSDCYSYSGSTQDAVMGALAALPPSVDVDSVVSTPLAKRIGHAMQDYGVYIVDTNPCWDPFTFNVENKGNDIVRSRYGYGFGDSPLSGDLFKLISRLNVVTNWNEAGFNSVKDSNGAQGVGGGAPRVAWAPDFGQPVDSPTPTPTPPSTPTLTTTPTPLSSPTPTPPSNTVSQVVSGDPASGTAYSVAANTNAPGDIRVEFKVDGNLYRTESDAPYSLFGDTNKVLNTGKLGAGVHTIAAGVYPQIGPSLITSNSISITEGLANTTLDTDKDGFTDTKELFMGTDPNKVCGVNAWPPDIDGDQAVTILDMTNAANSYNTKIGDPKYNKRYDMDTDGAITIADLNIIASYFLQRCTTPVMAPLASRPDVNQFIAVTSKVIEAETFKLNSGYADPRKNIFSDTTASGGKGFILWSPGSAQTVTSNGFGKATFRVKADVCQGGPKLTIKIDGKILYSQDFVSTSWTDITVNFAAVSGSNHTILVELANDRYRAGICDRNLRFDKVTLL